MMFLWLWVLNKKEFKSSAKEEEFKISSKEKEIKFKIKKERENKSAM
jgi:hypothetical protein